MGGDRVRAWYWSLIGRHELWSISCSFTDVTNTAPTSVQTMKRSDEVPSKNLLQVLGSFVLFFQFLFSPKVAHKNQTAVCENQCPTARVLSLRLVLVVAAAENPYSQKYHFQGFSVMLWRD